MADIFISYAREDRETIAKLAAALEGAGYSLWWDRHVAAGDEFSAEIERELKAAKAVIVAWSPQAAQSHWVKDEACHARDAGKLVPVSLDGGEPPMGFRQFQTISLSGWTGDGNAPSIQTLKESITKRTGAAASGVAQAAGAQAPPSQARSGALPRLWIAAAGAFAVLFIGLAVFFVVGGKPSRAPAGRAGEASQGVAAMGDKSIAVLPFKNFSPDKENEYFADGLTEELLNRLANVGGLKVTSRTSSFAFKDKDTAIPEIAKQLGVRHILEGSVRRDGEQLRVTAQLIDVSTDTHLWSETYDRKIEKIFALQDEIAIAVTDALKVALLGADDKPLAPVPTTSVELYGDYLKARQDLATYQFEPMKRAETALERIVAADPSFVPAATTLVELVFRMAETGIFPMAEAYGRAKPLVDRILAANARDAEAWLARSEILAFEGNSAGAAEARERAYALAPSSPLILRDQITRDYWARKPAGANTQIAKLIAVDPLSMFSYVSPMMWYGRTGDGAHLSAMSKRVFELFPGNPWPLAVPAVLPLPEDTNATIIDGIRRALEVEPTDPDLHAFLVTLNFDAGDPQEAERHIPVARRIDPAHPLAGVVEALGKAYRGDEAGARTLADPWAEPNVSSRWGSREIALRILAAHALAQDNAAEARRVTSLILSAYPEMERGDLASRFTFPALYSKWAHLLVAIDLAALYRQVGDTGKAEALQDAVEAELKYWPLRGLFGTGFAKAELEAARGDDRAALVTLRANAKEGLTHLWWFFLDKSPHFARLRTLPEFAGVRAEFAARAALPKEAEGSSPKRPN